MCVALLSGGSNRYKDHITEEPAKYVLLPILQILRETARFNILCEAPFDFYLFLCNIFILHITPHLVAAATASRNLRNAFSVPIPNA